ncbi:E3 ubiquitin-protein ligase XBAT32-like [Apium graveolens]|uniref:E3 ubiquitin-protein ligase XBAT32-like n=1 Tax=Apium graveolens TaxID=4045 RepID=UPI003D7AB3AD
MKFLSLVSNSFGCSASGERLVSAVRDGDLQEAKALLEYNPRLARYSTFGVRNSPLHYFAAQGHHEIVSLLLESGVDINLRNYREQYSLCDHRELRSTYFRCTEPITLMEVLHCI